MVSPGVVRTQMVLAGLFIMGFELLKQSVVEQPRRLYWRGSRGGKEIIDPDYKKDVLSRHQSTLQASALWFQEQGALAASDLEILDRVRRHRNELAHELAAFLVDSQREIQVGLLEEIRELIRRVDTWWILNFEVATDLQFAGQEIGPEDVQSGNMMLLDLMLSVAVHGYAESEEEVRRRFEAAFQKMRAATPPERET